MTNRPKAIPEEHYDFDSTELIGMFFQVCDMIDYYQIAEFIIFLDNNERLSPVIDFAHDFTSVMPEELEELEAFLQKKGHTNFNLNLYEQNASVEISFIDDQEILIDVSDNIAKMRRNPRNHLNPYKFNKKVLLDSIIETLDSFKDILVKFFPIAYEIFKEEKYIIK